MSTVAIHVGDCLHTLRTMPDASVQCCVTSPPYWGLRDYGHDGQIGLEATPESYVARMVDVFREVRRVLRDDGTCWVNLGDSYGSSKQLVGIPWRVAFALQADGWYLRQDIIWHKPNPMPESVRDRCTKSHEYVFLLSKSERYYYDAEAVSEPVSVSTTARLSQPSLLLQAGSDRVPGKTNGPMRAVGPRFGGNKYGDSDDSKHATKSGNAYQIPDANGRRNRRSVWTITTKPFSGAHFAVMPPDLADLCIRAGCPEGGVVLDPFGGAGTVGLVADRRGRDAVLCELNAEYAELARRRIADDNRLFGKVIVWNS
jgi:DNA modification methylase